MTERQEFAGFGRALGLLALDDYWESSDGGRDRGSMGVFAELGVLSTPLYPTRRSDFESFPFL